jgi:hypothetical protein
MLFCKPAIAAAAVLSAAASTSMSYARASTVPPDWLRGQSVVVEQTNGITLELFETG